MKYQSTRFGEFEVTDNEILNCPDGLYGFEQETQFALLPLDPNIDSPLEWLQSLTTPELAFVVTDPIPFVPDYAVTLTADDRRAIALDEEEAFRIRVIVTVPEDYRKMWQPARASHHPSASEHRQANRTDATGLQHPASAPPQRRPRQLTAPRGPPSGEGSNWLTVNSKR